MLGSESFPLTVFGSFPLTVFGSKEYFLFNLTFSQVPIRLLLAMLNSIAVLPFRSLTLQY
jgi:hypothetical protein